MRAFLSEQEVAIYYERTEVARFPRAQGCQARIDFRHIIAWLVRKPGAFRGYVHREELFPSLVYRQAYDRLKALAEASADRDYLELLALAADLGIQPHPDYDPFLYARGRLAVETTAAKAGIDEAVEARSGL